MNNLLPDHLITCPHCGHTQFNDIHFCEKCCKWLRGAPIDGADARNKHSMDAFRAMLDRKTA